MPAGTLGKTKFVVYGLFGRTLKEFVIGENETHHRAANAAREYGESLGHMFWWIALV